MSEFSPSRYLESALSDVVAERERQNAKWGEQNHPNGTGPDSLPLFAAVDRRLVDLDKASAIRDILRSRTDMRFSDGSDVDRPGTWADILLEEVFEALAERDPERLYAELVQVAAVAVQWGTAIKRRVERMSE